MSLRIAISTAALLLAAAHGYPDSASGRDAAPAQSGPSPAGGHAGSPDAPGSPDSASTPDRARPRRAGRVVTVPHSPSDMVLVPAGMFTMGPDRAELDHLRETCQEELGSARDFCAQDIHLTPGRSLREGTNFQIESRQVFLDGYVIDRYEVTGEQYRECVAAGYCDVTALVGGDERYIRDDWPMVNVSWHDAVDYCTFVGKRLPTEAEWEKAARGRRAFRWPWGNHVREDGSNHGKIESRAMQHTHGYGAGGITAALEYAPDDSDGHAYAARPGQMRWSESPYGAYDMAGNVAEWVYDYHGTGYSGLPTINPVRDAPDPDAAPYRTMRGGSWADPRYFGRTYYRYPAQPDERSGWGGFRCARSLDP